MIRDGDLGPVRIVKVEYVQGHNAALREGEQGAGKRWRFKPEKAGASLVLGDIGSHAHHLAAFVSGIPFKEVMADVGAVVPGRESGDDTAGALFRLENGAKGVFWVTQAAAGGVHGLSFGFLREGRARMFEETPNQLFYSRLDQPELVFERGRANLKPEALRAQRVAAGHPEGFLMRLRPSTRTPRRRSSPACAAKRRRRCCATIRRRRWSEIDEVHRRGA